MESGTGDRLREAVRRQRVRMRMSQADAAAMAGRSRKWLSDYERGRADAPGEVLFRLAAALGIGVSFGEPDLDL